MMSNVEMWEFAQWAQPLFPRFTLDPEQNRLALIAWDLEKRIRALEDQGLVRSDAQGVVEAESRSRLL